MPEAVHFDKAALAWTLPWDADWVTAVAFIGPTRRLAAGNNLGQILLWDLPEKPGGPPPPPVRRLEGHTNVVSRLLSSPDGRTLFSSSYDHTVRCWDLEAPPAGTGTVVLNSRAVADASSESGRRTGKKVPPAIEAKVQVQKAARVFEGHREWVQGVCQTRDGKLLLSGDDAGEVIAWEPAGKELHRWKVKGWVNALAVAPDGKQALIAERIPLVFDSGRHADVRLWDAAAGKPQRDLEPEFKKMHFIAAAAYSPDGKILAVGRGGEAEGGTGKVFLVDPATGKKVRELTPAHECGVTDLTFHPDGKHLASSGRDTVVRVWDAAGGKLVATVGKPRGGQFKDWIHAISFSADGRWLAGADMAGSVQVWNFPA